MNLITIHGSQRIKERTNFKGKAIVANTERAWLKGKQIEDFDNPRFKKYLYNILCVSGDADRVLRVFGGKIFLFSRGGSLVTILNIPEKINRNLGKQNGKNIYL